MKKMVMTALLLGAAFAAFGQAVNLDTAIRTSAEEIGERIDPGTKIAVWNIKSVSEDLSTYVIEGMNEALVQDDKLELAERDPEKLEAIRGEIAFGDSDEVNNRSAAQFGRLTGAKVLVTGSVDIAGGRYKLRIQALEAESGVRRYSKTFDIQNDKLVQSLVKDFIVVDFTQEQRVQAGALNLLFGAGSSAIMKDKVGGGVTAALEGVGVVGIVVGAIAMGIAEANKPVSGSYYAGNNGDIYFGGGSDGWPDDTYNTVKNAGIAALITGGVLYVGGFGFGAIRAAVYHKPGAVIAGGGKAFPFGIGLVSGGQGNNGLQLTYKTSF